MKKKLLFYVFCIFAAAMALFAAQPDPQASVIRGTYTQKNYTAKNNRTLQSSGDFLISKEHGMCWFAQKPQKTTVIMTEDAVIQITRGARKVLGSAENPVFKDIALIIKSLFSNDGAVISANLTESPAESGITYTPKEEPLKLVVGDILLVKNESGFIESVKIRFTNGDTTEYGLKPTASADSLTPEERAYFEK